MRLAVDQQEDSRASAARQLAPQLGDELAGFDPGRRTGDRGGDPRAAPARGRAQGAAAPRSTVPRRRRSWRWPTAWSGGASGSSAATAGPTTSASAGWTTSSPRAANVNILVLDTEVYSNTGGQASKATPRGAVAKFAAQGKAIGKKDLGMIAVAYGNVYVAQVAMGANPFQTLKAFQEAESYRGPSLIIAYSHCIAHGIEMSTSMSHQKEAAGQRLLAALPLRPAARGRGQHPFHLDSHKPTLPFKDFAMKEARFAMLDPLQPRAGRAAPAHWPSTTSTSAGTSTNRWRASSAPFPAGWKRCTHERRPDDPYLGLELQNPLVVSACPLTGKLDTLRRLEEPAPRRRSCPRCSRSRSSTTRWRSTGSTSTARRASPRPSPTSPSWTITTPGRTPTCGTSRRPSGRSSIPVIASLNGTSKGGWVRYARLDPGGRRRCARAEYLLRRAPIPTSDRQPTSSRATSSWCRAVREVVTIPLAVKMGPFFSSCPTWSSG